MVRIFFPFLLLGVGLWRNKFFYGFLWGLVAYGLHFIWIYILLVEKSHATSLLAFFLYFLIVIYSALTSGLWFMGVSFFNRFFKKNVISFFVSTFLYFFLLDRWMFWFFNSGYPFLNPFP